jgi:hypothetical protein
MPGETRNYTLKLPVEVASIDSIDIMFYQDGEKLFEYDDTMTERIYGIEGQPNLLVCSIPREDTLKFENRIRAQMQIEWDVDGYHSVAKAQRISVGDYLNKDYVEGM